MSSETRKDILDLLAGGKINVDEAAEMLAQLKEEETAVSPEPPAAPTPVAPPAAPKAPAAEKVVVVTEEKTGNGKEPSWFRVRVSNLETGKSKVTVNIPLRMLKFGFTLASHFTPEMDGLDMSELKQMLADGESGVLVDVQDEEGNEHVQVFID